MLGLQKAIDLAGGQSALARLVGLKQGHIWHWLNKSGRVPAEYVIPIETALEGKVTREELRPDLYPDSKADAEGAAAQLRAS